MTRSKSESELLKGYLTWIRPYSFDLKAGPLGAIRAICEREELLFLARYHHARSVREVKNALLRDLGGELGSEQVAYILRRWKKLFGAAGRVGALSANELCDRDGLGCQYCLLRSPDYEVHHVIPREKHGTNSPWNLVLTCRACNRSILNGIVIPRNWWILHPESRFSSTTYPEADSR